MSAFQALSATRAAGFGMSPISMAEIWAYCCIHEIDDPPELCRKVLACDRVFLENFAKREEAKRRAAGKGQAEVT